MRAFIVSGLGYGDEGKGAMVDHLCRTESVDTVVKSNGGRQHGHNVRRPPRVDPNGGATVMVHHEFHQWGAGSFVPGVRTHLAGTYLLDPGELFLERDGLASHGAAPRWENMSIDGRASIVTPFHAAANRIREHVRGSARHGSTGTGIWETQLDRTAGLDLNLNMVQAMSDAELKKWLRACQARKRADVQVQIDRAGQFHPLVKELFGDDVIDAIADTYRILAGGVRVTDGLPPDIEVAVFEMGQGALLSQEFGWHPYVTGSTSTDMNARAALWWGRDASRDEVTHIGCIRAYATRHGAGPFVTESDAVDFPEPDNRLGRWQGAWRQGYTDLVAVAYAASVQHGLDGLAVSHMDCVGPIDEWPVCDAYEWCTTIPVPRTKDKQIALTHLMEGTVPMMRAVPGSDVPEWLAGAAGVPLMYVATGPASEDRERVGAVV